MPRRGDAKALRRHHDAWNATNLAADDPQLGTHRMAPELRDRLLAVAASYDYEVGWGDTTTYRDWRRVERPTNDMAQLRIWPVVRGTRQPAALLCKPVSMKSISLISDPAKMDCAAFSPPAGTLRTGGTCLPAEFAKTIKGHVCRVCYAWGNGNYGTPSRFLIGQARRLWLQAALRGGGADYVGAVLAQAVVAANLSRHRSFGEDGGVTALGPSKYLRLHDEGDFFSPDYVEAWITAAQLLHLGGVVDLLPPPIQQKVKWIGRADAVPARIWAPTRVWAAFGDLRGTPRLVVTRGPLMEAVTRLAALPGVVVRPSAIRVGDPPPAVAGFAAGSGVDTPLAYQCPAYARKSDKTCTGACCRVCWEQPTMPVSYALH